MAGLLLAWPLRTATAVMVSLVETVIAPVYGVEAVVGKEPSMV